MRDYRDAKAMAQTLRDDGANFTRGEKPMKQESASSLALSRVDDPGAERGRKHTAGDWGYWLLKNLLTSL